MESEFCVHPTADVQTNSIGSGTKIWQYCVILKNATIGKDCNINAHVFIENDVVIGDRVTVKSGVQLWDGLRIEDDVFIGPNATFTNDKYPRSKIYPESFVQTIIKKGASIGANATILPGLTIGSTAMVGAGTVVTNNVPPNAKVVGNPARIIGYTETYSRGIITGLLGNEAGHVESYVDGVKIIQLPYIKDIRGDLSVGEIDKHIPFAPKRYFLVMGVPNAKVRGEHAHKTCHQFLVCVHGKVSVVVDDGEKREEILLDSPSFAVYVPPKVWSIQYKYSFDAVLMVLASDFYDADDYIRNYDEFLKWKMHLKY